MMRATVFDTTCRRVLAMTAMVLFAGAVAAQNYPVRPIRCIVPFPPGGAADLVGRVFAQQLTDNWGQQVVVDNRGGASGIIGVHIAAKSAADGYTVVQAGSTNFAIGPALAADLPYDPVKDFTPIALLAYAPNVLSGHPSVPAQSIKELIQLAKAKPGRITFGSPGTGTTFHIFGELFTRMAGIQLLHVPYKGGGPAFVDLLGGHVQLLFGALSTSLPSIKSGKLRGYGVTSIQRSPVAPELPTIAEAGLPGYEALQWFGIAAPAGTARVIVTKLNDEFVRMLNTSEMKERLLQAGLEAAAPNTAAEFAAYINKEVAAWSKVVKDAGIRVGLAK
jgi:tripartite-type tricarboxylate transporter receptor subunit TctC